MSTLRSWSICIFFFLKMFRLSTLYANLQQLHTIPINIIYSLSYKVFMMSNFKRLNPAKVKLKMKNNCFTYDINFSLNILVLTN